MGEKKMSLSYSMAGLKQKHTSVLIGVQWYQQFTELTSNSYFCIIRFTVLLQILEGYNG
jgi:hypothetical protein